jgi:hypothetical protein
MQKYLLDSCAMIGFFEKETGAEKVKSILAKAAISECLVLMHNASVAEVYYDAIRSAKQRETLILESLNSYPITFIEPITTDTIKWRIISKPPIKYHLQTVLFWPLQNYTMQKW